jgi:predicted nucleotidyltransferase
MSGALTLIERRFLQRTLENARHADCVVLVGSVARGTRMDATGDLDILVVNGDAPKLLHPGVQTTLMTLEALEERVLTGDDFAQWALRFGVSVRGHSRWTELRERLLKHAPWPDSDAKRAQARKRLVHATELLEMDDASAAQEELLYGISHLARASLLEAGVYPLSRPEMGGQLLKVGAHELAKLLDRVRLTQDLDTDELRTLVDRVSALAE